MSGILAGLRLDLDDEDFGVYLGDANLAQGWADTGGEWFVNIFREGAYVCDVSLGPFETRTDAITAAFDALLHRDGIAYTRTALPTFALDAAEATLSPAPVESGPERLLRLADANSTAQVSHTREQMRALAAEWQALEVAYRKTGPSTAKGCALAGIVADATRETQGWISSGVPSAELVAKVEAAMLEGKRLSEQAALTKQITQADLDRPMGGAAALAPRWTDAPEWFAAKPVSQKEAM